METVSGINRSGFSFIVVSPFVLFFHTFRQYFKPCHNAKSSQQFYLRPDTGSGAPIWLRVKNRRNRKASCTELSTKISSSTKDQFEND